MTENRARCDTPVIYSYTSRVRRYLAPDRSQVIVLMVSSHGSGVRHRRKVSALRGLITPGQAQVTKRGLTGQRSTSPTGTILHVCNCRTENSINTLPDYSQDSDDGSDGTTAVGSIPSPKTTKMAGKKLILLSENLFHAFIFNYCNRKNRLQQPCLLKQRLRPRGPPDKSQPFAPYYRHR